MEHTIRVVTDSGCDLPPDLAAELNIEVVPLNVHFGMDTYHDDELPAETFWDKAAGPIHPQTSQPPVGAFEQVFRRLVAAGNQVLCLAITGKHSGTYNAARLAAQPFGEETTVFDSQSISLGLGLQGLVAAQAVRDGRSMAEILALLEDLRARTRLLIILDTLEYLQQGGRAAAFIAVASRMTRALNIKVIINVVDGQLRLMGAARSFDSALRRVFKSVEGMGPLDHLAVVHTRRLQDAVAFADRLAKRTSVRRDTVLVREAGAALAAHAGPGVIGVMAVPASLEDRRVP
jgi:DegV family protein with EDD domain